MKIRSIELNNHHFFGNINFNFIDKNNNPFDTIIIAGENGTGKSILLNLIFEFSNITLVGTRMNEKRTFEIELSESEIKILLSNNVSLKYFENTYDKIILNICIDYNIVDNWNQIKIRIKNNPEGVSETIDGSLFNFQDNRIVLKTLFSDAEINFTPYEISTVTSTNIDLRNPQSEKSSLNIATEITQLLIDIQTLDALELMDWVKKILDNKLVMIRLK